MNKVKNGQKIEETLSRAVAIVCLVKFVIAWTNICILIQDKSYAWKILVALYNLQLS